jgi:Protein of unknown function (DUF2917)
MTIDLPYGKLLRIREGAGVAITAHGGVVWVTEQGSRRDVLLKPGERFTLGSPGLAVVEALDNASVSFDRVATLEYRELPSKAA